MKRINTKVEALKLYEQGLIDGTELARSTGKVKIYFWDELPNSRYKCIGILTNGPGFQKDHPEVEGLKDIPGEQLPEQSTVFYSTR
jgi:hypothetical protein